jgi:hypothetical protein
MTNGFHNSTSPKESTSLISVNLYVCRLVKYITKIAINLLFWFLIVTHVCDLYICPPRAEDWSVSRAFGKEKNKRKERNAVTDVCFGECMQF